MRASEAISRRLFSTMSKGDRGAFFAIGLGLGTAIALFFFVWAFPWFSDPTKSARYDCADDLQYSEQYHSPDDPQFWIRPFYGWIYAEDSLAQWIMAVFGIVATGVSFWAVIVVRDTLVVSRRATEAAVEAVGVNRRIGEAQTRAWVSYNNMSVHINARDGRISASVKFVWSNSGASPAINTTIRYMQFTTPMDFDFEDFPREQIPEVPTDKTSPIGPGKTTNSGAMPLSDEDISVIVTRRGRVFYWSEIVYDTIFPSDDGPRKSTACVEIEVNGILPGQSYDAERLKSALEIKIVGPFNYVS